MKSHPRSKRARVYFPDIWVGRVIHRFVMHLALRILTKDLKPQNVLVARRMPQSEKIFWSCIYSCFKTGVLIMNTCVIRFMRIFARLVYGLAGTGFWCIYIAFDAGNVGAFKGLCKVAKRSCQHCFRLGIIYQPAISLWLQYSWWFTLLDIS